MSHWWK